MQMMLVKPLAGLICAAIASSTIPSARTHSRHVRSIVVVSTAVAMHSIFTLYNATKPYMRGLNASRKFLSIKIVVAIILLQQFALNALLSADIIPEGDLGYTMRDHAQRIMGTVTIIEMALFSLMLSYLFSHTSMGRPDSDDGGPALPRDASVDIAASRRGSANEVFELVMGDATAAAHVRKGAPLANPEAVSLWSVRAPPHPHRSHGPGTRVTCCSLLQRDPQNSGAHPPLPSALPRCHATVAQGPGSQNRFPPLSPAPSPTPATTVLESTSDLSDLPPCILSRTASTIGAVGKNRCVLVQNVSASTATVALVELDSVATFVWWTLQCGGRLMSSCHDVGGAHVWDFGTGRTALRAQCKPQFLWFKASEECCGVHGRAQHAVDSMAPHGLEMVVRRCLRCGTWW